MFTADHMITAQPFVTVRQIELSADTLAQYVGLIGIAIAHDGIVTCQGTSPCCPHCDESVLRRRHATHAHGWWWHAACLADFDAEWSAWMAERDLTGDPDEYAEWFRRNYNPGLEDSVCGS